MFNFYFAVVALSVSALVLLFYHLDKIHSCTIYVYFLKHISVLQSEKWNRRNKSAVG